VVAAVLALLAAAPPRGVEACQTCHPAVAATYVQTAHFQASRPAEARSILGSFAPGSNVLRTRTSGVSFTMERRAGGFYQRGQAGGRTRSERFDIVIGSGRRGQSYLYWRNGMLFQLPVSYFVATGGWVNSPGYPDGEVHFDRVIPPRCLECHSTHFGWEGRFPQAKYQQDYALGLSCQKCHREGPDHATAGKLAPLSRERKIDACALCHSGLREPVRAPFSFRPGENLNRYLEPETGADQAQPEVHGNQVGLLRGSKCFRSSPEMTCSTCHNVHREERDIGQQSGKCAQCHEAAPCKPAAQLGPRAGERCVDCHMPDQRSNVITIQTPGRRLAQLYRTHRIAVYPEAAQAVLRSLR